MGASINPDMMDLCYFGSILDAPEFGKLTYRREILSQQHSCAAHTGPKGSSTTMYTGPKGSRTNRMRSLGFCVGNLYPGLEKYASGMRYWDPLG